jgi:hypothetical protein
VHDWPGIISDAHDHLLLPAVWPRVEALGLTRQIPPAVAQLLQTTAALSLERNQRILAEATHIAKLLNDIGIQPVALKGLAFLLAGIYPNLGSRHLQDIDLLIPEADIPRALEHLRQQGFHPSDADELVLFRHHAAALQRPNSPQVELHHSVGTRICRRLLPAAEIFRDAQPFELDGAHFLLPSATHLASHLVLHAQLLNIYRDTIFPRLRGLYDLQLLSQTTTVDWHQLVRRYATCGHYLTLALYLKEAERILAFPVPLPIELGQVGKLRWFHHLLLARYPRLRFADPVYLASALFAKRFRMLGEIVSQPRHWVWFVRAILNPQRYRNLLRV